MKAGPTPLSPEPPQPQAHARMNRPGDDVREVPEPRLIASHVLVGLFRGLVSSSV